jgi:hypothetical protein
MKFALHFSNCGEGESVEDYLLLVRHMLEALGHEVRYEFSLSVPAPCNVVVENFSEENYEQMRASSQNGADWVIVAPEFITGRTFNAYPNPDSGPYARPELWQQRFDTFVRCAEFARAVWLGIDDPVQVDAYRAVLPPHVQVVPLPFPFCPRLMTLDPPERDIDVLFTGNRTPHRMQILHALVNHTKLQATRYLPEYLRREFTDRAKITLALRQSLHWPYPSPLRLWANLTRGALVLAERCPYTCRLERYVGLVDGAEFAQAALGLLRSGKCDRLRRELHALYADENPRVPMARELLEQSFSTAARRVG